MTESKTCEDGMKDEIPAYGNWQPTLTTIGEEMKTSEELFSNKSDCYADAGQFQNDGSFQEGEVIQAMTKEKFVEALTEDRQQIKDVIKEMIEFYYKIPDDLINQKLLPEQNHLDITRRMAKIDALTELLTKINELK